MANIKIVGSALVVTSAKSMEALKTLEEYRPKALSLYETNEDTGKKEEVFRVKTGDKGSVGQYGITFDSTSHDDAALATVTLTIPSGVEDVKAYAAKVYGKAVVLLNKVEEGIDAALNTVKTEKEQVMANISVL